MSLPSSLLHDPHQRIELAHARFVDVLQGGYFPSQVRLIIQNGKIVAMPGLPGQPNELPADIRLDLHGKTVIPGLFNTHCHPRLAASTPLVTPRDLWLTQRYHQRQIEKGLADCVRRGITHIRDALTYDLRASSHLEQRIRAGEIIGPQVRRSILIAPPGGTFTQPGNLLLRVGMLLLGMRPASYAHPTSGVLLIPAKASAQQARAAVDRAIDERGAQTIKIYDQAETLPFYRPGAHILTDNQLQAIADQARRRGVPITMHHTTVQAFRRGVAAGITSFAHLPIDTTLGDADIEACLRAGCFLEPTLTIAYYYAWPMAGMPWNDHPNLAKLDGFRRQTMQNIITESAIPAWVRSRQKMLAEASRGEMRMMGANIRSLFRYWGRMIVDGVENLRRLYAAGVPVACGNDAGANPVSEAMIGLELALLGLFLDWSPAAALRAACLNSARTLGIADRYGSLEIGKSADLVLLPGDPLQDVSLVGGYAAATWQAGRLLVDAGGLCKSWPGDLPENQEAQSSRVP